MEYKLFSILLIIFASLVCQPYLNLRSQETYFMCANGASMIE